ncbi:MAG: hypothetical protein GC134_04625 [Proteobacteria bacterium]|nr:hypothetical protein [Pseudomonadota bacterium]
MNIADLADQFRFTLDARAATLTGQVLEIARTETTEALLVIVAEGPRHLLDNLLGYTAPYQATDDCPTTMMAVAFCVSDPEGAHVARAVEAESRIVAKVQNFPALGVVALT